MNERERSYVRKVLACLEQYNDWLSKSDICLLIDEADNASYLWGVIDALIAVNFIVMGMDIADNRFRLCRIHPFGVAWLRDDENRIPF